MWADYEEVYNLNCPKDAGNTAYASNYDITVNGIDWNAPGNQNFEGYWRIGGKSISTAVNRVITGKTSIKQKVTKMTINHNGKSRANVSVPSVTLTVASDADFNTIVDEVVVSSPTIAKSTEGSFDFTPTSPLTNWDNCYYKITINVSNSDSSNGGLDITSIVFYKTVSKTATTTTIDATGITNTAVNMGSSAGSLSASVTVTSGGATVDGATVSWTSSDEEVATVAADGTVTLVAAGTTTITASYAGDETHTSSSDTYDLTVTDTREACGLDYTDSYQTVKVGEVLAAPTLTNPYSLDVIYTSGDETIATVDASGNVTGVKIGATTITATFAGNSLYSAGSASYNINVKRATPAGELFYEGLTGYTSTNDGSSNLTNTYVNLNSDDWNSFSYVYAGKVLSGDADGHLKFGSSSYAGTAETNSIALTGSGKLTYKVQQYDSKNAGKLTISVTGATATGDLEVTGTSSWVEKTVYLTEAEGDVVITFASASDDKRIRVDDITVTQVTTAPATISTADYATFVHPAFDLDFSTTGITVYTATDNENSVTLNEVASGKVPANTPVVLYKAGADGSAIDVPVIASADAIGGTNDLHVSTGTDVANMYVLAKKTAGVGFYPWAGSTNLSAGKIYLQGKASYGAREFLGFANGSATTAINNAQFTNANEANAPVYNLNGQRVAQPTRGLYIVNGKKVIIK